MTHLSYSSVASRGALGTKLCLFRPCNRRVLLYRVRECRVVTSAHLGEMTENKIHINHSSTIIAAVIHPTVRVALSQPNKGIPRRLSISREELSVSMIILGVPLSYD